MNNANIYRQILIEAINQQENEAERQQLRQIIDYPNNDFFSKNLNLFQHYLNRQENPQQSLINLKIHFKDVDNINNEELPGFYPEYIRVAGKKFIQQVKSDLVDGGIFPNHENYITEFRNYIDNNFNEFVKINGPDVAGIVAPAGPVGGKRKAKKSRKTRKVKKSKKAKKSRKHKSRK